MKLRSNSFLAVLLMALVGCSGSDDDGDIGINTDPTVDVSPDNEADSSIMTNPLNGIGSAKQVGSGFTSLGGAAYRASDDSWYFSNIPHFEIFRLASDGSIELIRANQQTLGLAFDGQERLLIATSSGQTVSRLEETGAVTVLAESFEGVAFNAPHDLVSHTNGDVYFTDPPFFIDPLVTGTGCTGIYRIDADGRLSRFWCAANNSIPVGIALSPNQDRLYVSFSISKRILSWPISTDGSVIGDVNTFAFTDFFPSGMTVDAEGNLFVASSAGIEVFAPDGTRWGAIPIPEPTQSIALGGPDGNTLFFTGITRLYKMQLQ